MLPEQTATKALTDANATISDEPSTSDCLSTLPS